MNAKDISKEIARERTGARLELAAELADYIEKRLGDLATYSGECQGCRNAEARALLARLRRFTREAQ
jgi:hypothetical protein